MVPLYPLSLTFKRQYPNHLKTVTFRPVHWRSKKGPVWGPRLPDLSVQGDTQPSTAMEELQRAIYSIGGLNFLFPHHSKSEGSPTHSPLPPPARTRTTPSDPAAGGACLPTGRRITFDPTAVAGREEEVRQQDLRELRGSEKRNADPPFLPAPSCSFWLGHIG